MLVFDVTASPAAEDLDTISKGLASFNQAMVGPSEKQNLAVVVRNDSGEIVGGISGYTAWGWLYTQWLWIDESTRGQSLAGRMLEAAEAEARQRGCHSAHIDTFSAHALHVYKKSGYEVFGELPDFPKGNTRSFLKKSLVVGQD
ncbi:MULTISPECIES: GNAT family N-acetyltransferase [unclassified Devosia]|uniref:GNAT family N-acetyltransferase n=1 Tax=unclassified Devosia TaxID=196773 RepID=UPI00145E64E8|nr:MULTISPECIES: GNAT family N-acetyltransferase [unclassified Devosia]MBJ6987999.1 GNAT family N-acetyltransferase [Devosia sp. MC521]QMW62072.1 GNAT family N-acetyltransferase [Devosia sp. MC521]